MHHVFIRYEKGAFPTLPPFVLNDESRTYALSRLDPERGEKELFREGFDLHAEFS